GVCTGNEMIAAVSGNVQGRGGWCGIIEGNQAQQAASGPAYDIEATVLLDQSGKERNEFFGGCKEGRVSPQDTQMREEVDTGPQANKSADQVIHSIWCALFDACNLSL